MSLLLATRAAEAAFMADFDATSSAADFATFNGESNTNPNSVTVVADGGGNKYLVTSSTAQTATGTQMRFHVAPSLFEGAEVAIPTGTTAITPRTEARLSVRIPQITGGDDLPAEYPFTQFGFTEFNPTTNTPDYASKVIVQITNTLNQVTLSQTTNNAGGGNTLMGTYNIPGGAWTAGDRIELQVTENQARLLYNGVPMLSTDATPVDYKNLPASFFANNFAAGNQLIPFFGVIRGSVLEAGDTLTAGFDDINARNVTVPEPSSLAVAMLFALGACQQWKRTSSR
jgi:hypothetical protein